MGSTLQVSNPNQWAATVEEIHSLNTELNGLAYKTVAIAARIGEILVHVRGALHRGKWLPWLEEFAPFSRQSSDNYIWIFENQAKLLNVGNLSEAYRLKLEERNGKNGNQLHESNFYTHSIRLTQRLMGDVNHEIKDHPIESWGRDKWISLAAATEPVAELHQRLKSLIG